MKQAIINQTRYPKSGCACYDPNFFKVFSKNILLFLLPSLLMFVSSACSQKNDHGGTETTSVIKSGDTIKAAPLSGQQNSVQANIPPANADPKITGFPSVQEFRDLLGADPQYAGFARMLNEDYLLKYINIREAFDFVFFVPSEKNQDPKYLKQYLSYESAPVDKNAFWLNHIAVCSKGMPFDGNPTVYNVMLKRNKQVIAYEGGSANILSEKRLKDGTQVIFIDKPFKIPIRN